MPPGIPNRLIFKGHPEYNFLLGIAHMRDSMGDGRWDKSKLESIHDLMMYSKLRKFRPLFHAIYERIRHDGYFDPPLNITPMTSAELDLDNLV